VAFGGVLILIAALITPTLQKFDRAKGGDGA
jgi:hypothetical protein